MMIILTMTCQGGMTPGFMTGGLHILLLFFFNSLRARLNPLIPVAYMYPKTIQLAAELKGFFIHTMSLMRLGPAQFCTATLK